MLPLIFYFSLLSTLFGASTATDWPTPVLTTNSSLVQRGQPFTAKCEMLNFVAPSEEYYLHFWRNDSSIFYYYFPAASSGGIRQPTITNNSDSSITVRSLWYTLTSVKVEVTPLTIGDFEYKCENPGPFSMPVNVKVVEHLPTVTFTLNTSSLTVSQPFIASCAIANYIPTTNVNYTVTFESKRDGRLATYQTVHGTSLILIEKHATLLTQKGPQLGPHVFELTLVESQNVSKAEYWCQLDMPNLGTISSKHWSQETQVSFTSRSPNSTTRLGTCSVEYFEPAGKEYSVQFWTDLGPKSVNRLAAYAVKPNQLLEFDIEEVPGWTNVQTGDAVSLPSFTILATGSSAFHGSWWCVLAIGAEGSAGYREIKSGAADLA